MYYIFSSLRCTVYTPSERINIWSGKAFAKMFPAVTEVACFNAFLEVPALKIPIYFLAGIYDYTCSYSLQREYYDQIQALMKTFYTFHRSAHSPLFEEPEIARLILRGDVLTGNANHTNTR